MKKEKIAGLEHIEPYNPLDKKNLGESIADAMLKGPARPLGELEVFSGAGIYALYYEGDFEAYRNLVEKNKTNEIQIPIYVGKAVQQGSRKGDLWLNRDPGPALFKRLGEHAASIREVENLRIEDFKCRYLVVDDIWIPLGESLLISKFSPVWNKVLDGFGGHNPGTGRYNGQCPKWDTVHPGRWWTSKLSKKNPETKEQLIEKIKEYLETI